MKDTNVNSYLIANAKCFSAGDLPAVRTVLEMMSDDDFVMLQAIELKDPTIMLVISLLAGGFGIDRFLLGDIFAGLLKLLTAGGFGIFTMIDWFLIRTKTKEYNYETFMYTIAALGTKLSDIVFSVDPQLDPDGED